MAARARNGNAVGAGALTGHDVARLAGVSQATVSRVLRDDPKVRPEMSERVMRVVTETRYQPNAAARAFRTSRSGAIGVVVARLSYHFFPAMLEAIGARLTALGQRMIVWDAEYGGDLQAAQALRQGAVDGVILTASTAESEFLTHVAGRDAPVVLVNRTIADYPSDQVSSDNIGGGARVADYLLAGGRRNIALIGGIHRASTIRDREHGFREALRRAGRELPTHYYQRSETFTYKSGQEAAIRLLELQHPPDAMFCVNDVLAAGAMDGARAHGARVPEDLWIVGYDDIELASWGAYELTTVRQPVEDMVVRAIVLLQSKIEDRSLPLRRECFPDELVIRRSTGRASLGAASPVRAS
jgi:LacI family transcriptional regulator